MERKRRRNSRTASFCILSQLCRWTRARRMSGGPPSYLGGHCSPPLPRRGVMPPGFPDASQLHKPHKRTDRVVLDQANSLSARPDLFGNSRNADAAGPAPWRTAPACNSACGQCRRDHRWPCFTRAARWAALVPQRVPEWSAAIRPISATQTTRCILDEHRFRAPGNLIVSNLDRITHVHDVGNQRPRDP
jgi:hypothetical protein